MRWCDGEMRWLSNQVRNEVIISSAHAPSHSARKSFVSFYIRFGDVVGSGDSRTWSADGCLVNLVSSLCAVTSRGR